MPIDYSKFDSIADSDEEEPVAGTVLQQSDFAKESRVQKNTLEPTGLDDSLRIVGPSSMDAAAAGLASELERWAAPRSSSSGPISEPAPQTSDEPKRMCVKADGRRKIHTTFPDGSETVEEFDERSDVLLLRKVRRPTSLGKESEWIFEVGQPVEPTFDPHSDLLRASSSNPICVRKDTPEHFQWRIRNLPFPAQVYSVTVDHDKQEIVVRTSNKKYYKRLGLPDLTYVNQKLCDASLTWKHQHNTLIISYTKPAAVVDRERKLINDADRSAVEF